MKVLTAIAIAAVLLMDATIASAQNTTPTTKVAPSPSNINKSNRPTVPSGAEASSAATGHHARAAGRGKFCIPTSANGPLNCRYASMSACEAHNKSSNLKCVANPRSGT
jgi:hypothetical protein